MNDYELSTDECQVLIEALDAWISKDVSGALIGDMMTALLIKKDNPEYQKVQDERDVKNRLLEGERLARSETASLIKAKLIMHKRQLVAAGVRS